MSHDFTGNGHFLHLIVTEKTIKTMMWFLLGSVIYTLYVWRKWFVGRGVSVAPRCFFYNGYVVTHFTLFQKTNILRKHLKVCHLIFNLDNCQVNCRNTMYDKTQNTIKNRFKEDKCKQKTPPASQQKLCYNPSVREGHEKWRTGGS